MTRKKLRQSELISCLTYCGQDCHKVQSVRHCEKVKLLIDKILELQDNLALLQEAYVRQTIELQKCVQVPF